ncbi:hypothetical protein B4098_0240 [Heyndrickxia coagulans]|uniref:Uncharacterized protein n=1 Tax=Heyndrickxia coagulans TaxID=1398 RepID=A0A150K6T0_HEYCO|nr:hypothetical protein B4098_0240 [Heyndrickxia coagulans]
MICCYKTYFFAATARARHCGIIDGFITADMIPNTKKEMDEK